MAYEYAYDDRTTGYDAHESFGRHGDDDDDAYDHGGGHAVSHSHSYGRPQHDYPPQPYPRHRASQQPAYEYAHGEYDYPTGVAAEASTPDEYAPPSREHASYDPDRIASDDGAYGAGGYGGRSDRGSATPGAYGAGRTTVGDIWAADEKHGRVRDERPMLLGYVLARPCSLLLLTLISLQVHFLLLRSRSCRRCLRHHAGCCGKPSLFCLPSKARC